MEDDPFKVVETLQERLNFWHNARIDWEIARILEDAGVLTPRDPVLD